MTLPVLALALAAALLPSTFPPAPDVSASAYIVVDTATGQTLLEQRADERRAVASTVKILTAMTVLERVDDLGEVVTVGAEVATVGGAGVGLRPGDRWTVEQLLAAMIARSGNDAATALAVHVGGSVPAFARLMQRDAAEAGLTGVTLETPSGLDDTNRLSARDLATLAVLALDDPDFRRLAGAPHVDLPGGRGQASRNRLLFDYPGATGVKTGQTNAAGWSVVGSAQRDGREVVAVVLDSDGDATRFLDAARLLDHGLDRFANSLVSLRVDLAVPGGVRALRGDPVRVTAPIGAEITADLVVPIEADGADITVPIHLGDSEVARLLLQAGAGPPDATGGAAVGAWVWGRAYAAMRAATAAGEW